jgi:hypothetical protein
MIFWLVSSLIVFLVLLAPIIHPRIITNPLYKLNFPFFIIIGAGVVITPPSPYFHDINAVYSAYIAVSLYVVFILTSIFYLYRQVRQWLHQNKSLSLTSPYEFSRERRIPIDLQPFTYLCFSLILLLCLPYWFVISPQNSGLISLLTNPEAHLALRESSLKLADKSIALTLYKIGSSLRIILLCSLIHQPFLAIFGHC